LLTLFPLPFKSFDRIFYFILLAGILVINILVLRLNISIPRYIYVLITVNFTLFFVLFLVFFAAIKWDNKDYLLILFSFNLIVIILSYFNTWGFSTLKNELVIGYSFGHFQDFFINSHPESFPLLITTGYFPLSFAIAAQLSSLLFINGQLSSQALGVYCVYLVGTLAPLLILTWRRLRESLPDPVSCVVIFLLFLTSYPIAIAVERGNYSLISVLLLLLALFTFKKGQKNSSAIFWGILIALKALNIIYFLIVIRYLNRKQISLSVVTLILVTGLSLLLLGSFDFTGIKKFGAVFEALTTGKVGFSDPAKLVATSGLDSLRVLLHTLFHGITTEIVSGGGLLSRLYLPIGALVTVIYFFKHRSRNNILYDVLFITCITLVFHPTNADYNLLLVLVPAIYLIPNGSLLDKKIFRILSLILLLTGAYAIGSVACCGEGLGRYVTVTIRGFVICFALSYVATLIFFGNKKNEDYRH
jgi:hypothetical protein